MENKPVIHSSDVFDKKYQDFQQTALFNRLQDKFEQKPYFQKFKSLRSITLIASYLFNGFSAFTAATLVFFFIFTLVSNYVITSLLTCAFVLLLEIGKRKTSSIFFATYLQYRKFSFLFAVVLLLSCLSIVFSYFGAQKLVHEFKQAPTLVISDSLTAQLVEQVAIVDQQIEQSERTQWKGKTTRTAQKAKAALSQQKADLQAEIIRVRQRADNRNDKTELVHTNSTILQAKNFALITFVLELLFLICAFYLEYYDYRSFAEFSKTDKPTETVKRNGKTVKAQLLNDNKAHTDKRMSEKSTVKGTRLCANCATDISNKRKGAKYCSDTCRREKWTVKNGRVPYLKEKK